MSIINLPLFADSDNANDFEVHEISQIFGPEVKFFDIYMPLR